MIVTYTCPHCDKRIPGGESGGHCGICHESFRGGAAFDKHLIRTSGRPIHQHPANATTPKGKSLDYWQDEKGVWHLGPRDPRFTKKDTA